jgi:outer membrane protein TolC
MKSFSIELTACLFLAALPSGIRADSAPPPPTGNEITSEWIDRLAAEAEERNPALQAAKVRAEAANSAVSSVRTWEDPVASLGLWAPGPGGFSSRDQGNIIYGIDEKLPLYGRPDLVRKLAAADASRDQLTSDLESRGLRRDLRVALIGLALADRESEIAGQDLAWLDATLDAVDRRYRVGQASQVDWLKAQSARALAVDDLKSKEQERGHGAFALNRLLNRNLHEAWPAVSVPALQPPLFYTEGLIGAAMAAEPRLRVMRQESLSAQAAADLTRRQRLPDVSVGVQAWQYSGDGGLRQAMATVSMSLPWVNGRRYDADWRRDLLRKRASDLSASDYELTLREELHHDIVDIDAARRRAVLFQEQMIPLAEQTLASAQTAWEHSVGPLEDVLEAHRTLLADQLALDGALSDQAIKLAEVSFATGCPDTRGLFALAGASPADHETPSSNESK